MEICTQMTARASDLTWSTAVRVTSFIIHHQTNTAIDDYRLAMDVSRSAL